jgi:hypothetical protein
MTARILTGGIGLKTTTTVRVDGVVLGAIDADIVPGSAASFAGSLLTCVFRCAGVIVVTGKRVEGVNAAGVGVAGVIGTGVEVVAVLFSIGRAFVVQVTLVAVGAGVPIVALGSFGHPLFLTAQTGDTGGRVGTQRHGTFHGRATDTGTLKAIVVFGAFVVVDARTLHEWHVLYLSLLAVIPGTGVFIIEREGGTDDALSAEACIAHRAVVFAVVTGKPVRNGRMTTGDVIFFIACTDILGADVIVKATKSRSDTISTRLRTIFIPFSAEGADVFLRAAIFVITGSAFIGERTGHTRLRIAGAVLTGDIWQLHGLAYAAAI